ncbi:Protein of unknown function [Bacillus cytotoxicus]|nr:Protein of unknown function [Bacillus cytotoxicus]SCN35341.1 Protein of unknown function [Bacillus cytotoxicus]
MSKEGL